MGMTPMANLIALPPARTFESKLEPLPMERVEDASRSGDETYSPHGGGTGRGSEDGAPDGEEEGLDGENEPEARPIRVASSGTFSFFA